MMLLFITAASPYTAMLLIGVQEAGQRTYYDVADSTMGKGFSNIWGKPFQLLYFFPITCVMILIGGQAIANIACLAGTNVLPIELAVNIAGLSMILLAFLPDLNHAWMVSIIGAISAVIIPIICIAGSIVALLSVKGSGATGASYDRPAVDETSFDFGVLSAFGYIVFGYGYHSILPDIQYSLRDKNSHDAHADTRKVVKSSVGIAFPAYVLVATLGYAAFGNEVSPNIFDSIRMVLGANIMYFAYVLLLLKVIAEGSLYNQAAFTLIEDLIFHAMNNNKTGEEEVKERVAESGSSEKGSINNSNPASNENKETEAATFCSGLTPLWTLHMAIRIAYVAIAVVIAIEVHFFTQLASITGAVGITPLTFILPIVFWNRRHGQEASTWRLRFHYLLMAIFIAISLCALIGSIVVIATAI
jgi:amino acid permease